MIITKNHRLAGEAIRKLKTGDPISDDELAAGIAALSECLIPALSAMGSRYDIVTADLRRQLTTLEGMKSARRHA